LADARVAVLGPAPPCPFVAAQIDVVSSAIPKNS
jgi:hypothetical protein